jgi:hypothetical protein
MAVAELAGERRLCDRTEVSGGCPGCGGWDPYLLGGKALWVGGQVHLNDLIVALLGERTDGHGLLRKVLRSRGAEDEGQAAAELVCLGVVGIIAPKQHLHAGLHTQGAADEILPASCL